MADDCQLVEVPKYLLIDLIDSGCAQGPETADKFHKTITTLSALINAKGSSAPTTPAIGTTVSGAAAAPYRQTPWPLTSTPASAALHTAVSGAAGARGFSHQWPLPYGPVTPSRRPQAPQSGPLFAPFTIEHCSGGPTIGNVEGLSAPATTGSDQTGEEAPWDHILEDLYPLCSALPAASAPPAPPTIPACPAPPAPSVPSAPAPLPALSASSSASASPRLAVPSAPQPPSLAAHDADSSTDTLIGEGGAVPEAGNSAQEKCIDESPLLTAEMPPEAKGFAPVVKALQENPLGLSPAVFIKTVNKAFNVKVPAEQQQLQFDWQATVQGTIAAYVKAISPWVCIVDNFDPESPPHEALIRLQDVTRPYFQVAQPIRLWKANLSRIIFEQVHGRALKRKRQSDTV
ncbi:hypothetical protein OC835_006174 [Tilletia horrida]|nr:hypothetical protein OC835_006174 [Tilletia horrida]